MYSASMVANVIDKSEHVHNTSTIIFVHCGNSLLYCSVYNASIQS